MKKLVVALVCACLLASCGGGDAQSEKALAQAEKMKSRVENKIYENRAVETAAIEEELEEEINKAGDDIVEQVVSAKQEEDAMEEIHDVEQTTMKKMDKSSDEKSGKRVLLMETNKFRISVNKLNNNKFRYSSWHLNQSMNDTPNLVLDKGTYHVDATSGNRHYIFNNGAYKYTCFVSVKGEAGTPTASLVVSKNGNTLVDQSAKVIEK